jgi:cryptochrome
VYWFRKALRLHDSPSLLAALSSGTSFCPLFLIDPFFRVSGRVGALRYNHLIETLVCLDKGLKERGSSLVVIEGWPQDVFAKILQLSVTLLAFESDTEPYAVTRDAEVRAIAEKLNVEVITASGHTLFDLEEMKKRAKGKVPSTYGQFCKLISDYNPAKPVPAPERLPSLPRNDWVQEALKTCPSGE